MKKLLIILFLSITTLLGAHTNYYIDPAGTDGAGVNGSIGTPWLTLAYAATRVTTAGDTIHVNAGTYIETAQTVLSAGVSIVGVGYTSYIHSHVTTANTPTIYANSVSITAGSQSISNIKMDGGAYTAWSAIKFRNRTSVSVHDCTIENFYAEGVGFYNSSAVATETPPATYLTGITFYNNVVTNSSIRDIAYAGGNLTFCGVSGMLIYGNTLTIAGRTSTHDGMTINCTNGHWKESQIYSNTLSLQPYTGEWNFATEIKWSQGGNIFHDNIVTGQVDFCYNYKNAYSYSIDVYNNTIRFPILEAYYTVGINLESSSDGVIIRNNHISNTQIPILANFGYLATEVFSNIYIYYNILDTIGKAGDTAAGWAISFASQTAGKTLTADNINIWNNNIVGTNNGTWEPTRAISIAFSGAWTNVEIINNIIYDFKGAGIYGTEGLAGATMDYLNIENNNFDENGYSDVPTFVTIVPSHYTYQNNNLNSPPQWTGGSPYDYTLQAGSPCINTGLGVGLTLDYLGHVIDATPDMGAYEYGATEPTPPPNLPSVTTVMVNYWSVGANVSGTDIDDGGGTVTDRGVCWNTTVNPVITDSHIHLGMGILNFTCKITGLTKSTTYHIRTFVTNAEGTSYGEDIEFKTPAISVGRIYYSAVVLSNVISSDYYYVSNSGSDDSTGLSPAQAWKTIAKVNATTLVPGDHVYFNRGDEWREKLTVAQSGTALDRIIITAYGTGAKPIINGANIATGWVDVYNSVNANIWGTANTAETATQQVVVIDDTLYTPVATLAEINSTRKYFLKTSSTPDSIFVWSVADPDSRIAEVSARNYSIDTNGEAYITVSNVEVRNAGHSGLRFGNSVVGFDGYAVADSVLAHTNRLAGIIIVGDFDHATITNCVATYNGNGIEVWGNQGGSTGPNHVTVSHCYTANGVQNRTVLPKHDGSGVQFYMSDSCTVEYCESNNDPYGIYLDPGGAGAIVVNMTARYNYVHNGAGVSSGAGIGINNFIAGSVCNIYYNLLVNDGGTEIGAIHSDYTAAGQINIYNNTIYENITAGFPTNNIKFVNGANVTLKNNIYWFTDNYDQYEPALRIITSNGFVSDYNQYYRSWNYYIFRTDAASYANVAALYAATGREEHGNYGNPLFTTNGSDFTLQAGSPCINDGVVIPGIPQTDILGNPIVGVPDMGCYEKQ